MCGEKYATRTRLKNHINRKHTFVKNYKCTEPDCEAEFYGSSALKRHTIKVHRGIRFNCQVPGCASSLSRRDAYLNHLKSHRELSKAEHDELINKLNDFCHENKC